MFVFKPFRALLGSTALIAACALPAYADTQLHILHINDFHSRIEHVNRFNSTCSASDDAEGKCFGGAARLCRADERLRRSVADDDDDPGNHQQQQQGRRPCGLRRRSCEGRTRGVEW